MFTRILIGYDGSVQSEDALALARVVANAAGADLVVAGIACTSSPSSNELRRMVDEAAAGLAATPVVATSGSAAHGLHELAEALDRDLIVVGSSYHGGFGRVVAGGTAERLLHGAPCAVAIAPNGYRQEARDLRVLAVGYDGADASVEALACATALAQDAEATLRLLTAVDPQAFPVVPGSGNAGVEYREAMRGHLESSLEEALDSIPPRLRAAAEQIRGDVVRGLVGAAEKGVDLLFVGSRGHGPVRRVLLGSVSSRLIHSSPCPLVVVPRGVHARPESIGVTGGEDVQDNRVGTGRVGGLEASPPRGHAAR